MKNTGKNQPDGLLMVWECNKLIREGRMAVEDATPLILRWAGEEAQRLGREIIDPPSGVPYVQQVRTYM